MSYIIRKNKIALLEYNLRHTFILLKVRLSYGYDLNVNINNRR